MKRSQKKNSGRLNYLERSLKNSKSVKRESSKFDDNSSNNIITRLSYSGANAPVTADEQSRLNSKNRSFKSKSRKKALSKGLSVENAREEQQNYN